MDLLNTWCVNELFRMHNKFFSFFFHFHFIRFVCRFIQTWSIIGYNDSNDDLKEEEKKNVFISLINVSMFLCSVVFRWIRDREGMRTKQNENKINRMHSVKYEQQKPIEWRWLSFNGLDKIVCPCLGFFFILWNQKKKKIKKLKDWKRQREGVRERESFYRETWIRRKWYLTHGMWTLGSVRLDTHPRFKWTFKGRRNRRKQNNTRLECYHSMKSVHWIHIYEYGCFDTHCILSAYTIYSRADLKTKKQKTKKLTDRKRVIEFMFSFFFF